MDIPRTLCSHGPLSPTPTRQAATTQKSKVVVTKSSGAKHTARGAGGERRNTQSPNPVHRKRTGAKQKKKLITTQIKPAREASTMDRSVSPDGGNEDFHSKSHRMTWVSCPNQ